MTSKRRRDVTAEPVRLVAAAAGHVIAGHVVTGDGAATSATVEAGVPSSVDVEEPGTVLQSCATTTYTHRIDNTPHSLAIASKNKKASIR